MRVSRASPYAYLMIGSIVVVLGLIIIWRIIWSVLPAASKPIPSPTGTSTPDRSALILTQLPTLFPARSTPKLPLTPPEPVPTPVPDLRFAIFESAYGMGVDRKCEAPCSTVIRDLKSGQLLALGDFVSRVGFPDKVVAKLYPGGEQPPFIYATMYYVKQGFSIIATLRPPLRDEITRDMVVDRLTLFQSRSVDAIAAEQAQLGAGSIWEAEDWTGFGPIKVQRAR